MKKKVLIIVGILFLILVIGITIYFVQLGKNKIVGGYELTCFLNGETSKISVFYNKQHDIITIKSGLSNQLHENVKIYSYNSADKLASDITNYCKDNGGTCYKKELSETEASGTNINVQAVSEDELNELKDSIIQKVSEKSDYKNFTNCYVDKTNFNLKLIVELVNNSQEEQEWFKENINDSEYIKFIDTNNSLQQ